MSCVLQLALEELDYEVESVVSAVLEDKLPVKLRQVHSSLDRWIKGAVTLTKSDWIKYKSLNHTCLLSFSLSLSVLYLFHYPH